MDPIKPSHVFDNITFVWKLFGMWSDKSSSKYLRIYSWVFIALFYILYTFLYTLSLVYTPRTVDVIATQVVFYFSTTCGFIEIIMILIKRQEIISVFEAMDCKEFQGNDDKTNEYLRQSNISSIRFFKTYAVYCTISACVCLVGLPLLNYFYNQIDLKMPIWEYYFLTNDTRNKHFFYLYIYQTVGMVSTVINHVLYNAFQYGLLTVAITQFKILNWNIENIRLDDKDLSKSAEEKERLYLRKFYNSLDHYEIILKYCQNVQDLITFLIFVNYGSSVLTLCFSMFMLLLPTSQLDLVLMAIYTSAMLTENFVPSFLGSQLTNESDNLRFAVYSCDWVPRSKPFKACLMILVERAHRPVLITGLKIVPLSLETFTSIVKTAYSFFTLLRGAQDSFN